MQILKKLFSIRNKYADGLKYKILTIFGHEIKINEEIRKKAYYQLIEENQIYKKALRNLTPKTHLEQIEVNITEHCNLNCQSCDHFSSIAEPEFLDIQVFENDIKRLSELTNGHIDRIYLLGGEPLLHPDINKFSKITRKYFPKSLVSILTNGILLDKQQEDFWQTCKNYNIEIWTTKYPIKVDYDNLSDLCQKHGISFKFFFGGDEIKTSYKRALDLNGNQNPIESFKKCGIANNCIMLNHGKIYTCTLAPCIRHFNKYFNQNLNIKENDGIDIYKVKDIHEILNFCSSPIHFCKYCNIDANEKNIPWSITKRNINEWVSNS